MPEGRPWEYTTGAFADVPQAQPDPYADFVGGLGGAQPAPPAPDPASALLPDDPRTLTPDQVEAQRMRRAEDPASAGLVDTRPAELDQLRQLDQELEDAGFPAPAGGDALWQRSDELAATAAQLNAMADQRVSMSAPNPEYPSVAGHTGRMLGDDGVLIQQEQAAEQLHEAQRRQAQVEAQAFEQRAAQYRDMAIDHKAAEHVRQEQLREQYERQREAVQAHEDAAKRAREAQALDPDKWWSDKTTGQKILAGVGLALSALGGGWASKDASYGAKLRQQIVDGELAKQREQYSRLQDSVATAERQVGLEGSLYAQTMAKVQDQRQADLIVENAVIEAMQAEAEAMMQQAGVDVLTAEQQAFMADLRGRQSEIRMQLERLAALTPKRRVVSGYAYDPATRADLQRRAAEAEEGSKRLKDIGYKAIESEAVRVPEIKVRSRVAAEESRVGKAMKDMATFEAARNTAQELLEMPDLERGVLDRHSAAGKAVSDRLRRLPGFLSPGEDPDDITWDSDARARLRAYIKDMEGEMESLSRPQGDEQYRRYMGRQKEIDTFRTGGDAPKSLRRME